MKVSIIIFLVLFIWSAKAQTLYPSGVSGCIARWTFDDEEGGNLSTIQDWSGNNNHGSNNNITSVAGWNGVAGKAGKFNGSNSYSQVPFNQIFLTNRITAMALVKFDGFYAGTCQGNNLIYNGFNYNSDLNWSLYTSDYAYDADCYSYNANYNKTYFTTPNYLNNGVPQNNYIDSSIWYLIGASFDGSVINYYEIKMDTANYINNILPSYSVANNHQIGNGVYDIFMGATQNPPYPYWFNGKMDEVVLFNKALSPTEIQSVYNYLYGSIPSATADYKSEKDTRLICRNKRLTVNSGSSNIKSVKVSDMNGRTIWHESFINEIDLSDLPVQMLFVQVISSNNIITSHKILLAE